jgi:hypothetical protein
MRIAVLLNSQRARGTGSVDHIPSYADTNAATACLRCSFFVAHASRRHFIGVQAPDALCGVHKYSDLILLDQSDDISALTRHLFIDEVRAYYDYVVGS